MLKRYSAKAALERELELLVGTWGDDHQRHHRHAGRLAVLLAMALFAAARRSPSAQKVRALC